MNRILAASGGTALMLGLAAGPAAISQETAFGDDESVSYAEALWEELQQARLVGEDVIRSHAYEGSEPHGVVLEQTETRLTVQDHTGTVIVKHNFMVEGEELTVEQVMNAEWTEYLDAVTVMFRREQGYDDQADDWFWAKYFADGSLDQTPGGMAMAGRVPGCIECHENAPGGDFVFLHQRYER